MRAIKFRAWDKSQSKMLYSYEPENEDHGKREYYPFCIGIGFSNWRKEDLAIMQSADYFDDNDQEVWEGDIVEVSYGVGKVIFHNSCFMIEWVSDPEANMELLSFNKKLRARDSLKVIGNIYENAELLQH